MSATSLFPTIGSIFLLYLAVRLHVFCDKMHRVYRSATSEQVSLIFFNKLSLGSVFVGILILLGELSWAWNVPATFSPPVEEYMWDLIESIIILLLSWLCYHAPSIVSMKTKYSEVARKNKILEGIITAAAGYVWLKDSEGCYVFCDHCFCNDFFGLKENNCQVIGFGDLDLIDAYRTHTGRHDFGNMCLSTDNVTKMARVPCHFIECGVIGDHLFVLDVIKTPLYDRDGNYEGVVGFAWKNRACDCDTLLPEIDEMVKKGKAIKLTRGVYQLFDLGECVIADHAIQR